jgi:hypothetical protein
VLAFYPASRLDWVALTWLSAITIAEMPGVGSAGDKTLGRVLAGVLRDLGHLAQLVMLAALIAFVVLCLTRRWNATPEADAGPAVEQMSGVPVGGSGS